MLLLLLPKLLPHRLDLLLHLECCFSRRLIVLLKFGDLFPKHALKFVASALKGLSGTDSLRRVVEAHVLGCPLGGNDTAVRRGVADGPI